MCREQILNTGDLCLYTSATYGEKLISLGIGERAYIIVPGIGASYNLHKSPMSQCLLH